LSEIFRQANKLNYEIEGQINEVYYGREFSKDLKTSVIPAIKYKIDQLNLQMEELNMIYGQLEQS
jgi:hypothetical protein